MKLVIVTICLDGMPFLPMQLATFNRLNIDWQWIIVEGVAANVNCTKWCADIIGRFSRDGSHEFILSLKDHPRIGILGKQKWDGGKVEMCNAALSRINEECILMQIDTDELWEARQLESIHRMLSDREVKSLAFTCRYFLGPNIITAGPKGCYGNRAGEWVRAWRFQPGMRFLTHEPPRLNKCLGIHLDAEVTSDLGFSFDHWAYMFESQVQFKEQFYRYAGAVDFWRRLQHDPDFTKPLSFYLPWVKDKAAIAPLYK